MGGPVSMRALLTTDVVRAASFWSTMPMDGLFEDLGDASVPMILQHSEDDQITPISNSERFQAALSASAAPVLHRYSGPAHYFEEAEREQAADRDAAFFRAAPQ